MHGGGVSLAGSRVATRGLGYPWQAGSWFGCSSGGVFARGNPVERGSPVVGRDGASIIEIGLLGSTASG